MFALAILYPVALVLSQRFPGLISLFGLATIFNATAFAPTLFFALGQQQLGRDWKRALPAIFFITVLGAGMMVNTLRAALGIFSNSQSAFERTPKFGIEGKTLNWTRRRYQLKLDPIVYAEIAFALFNFFTALLAIYFGNYLISMFALLFCGGLCFSAGTSIGQALQVHLNHPQPTAPTANTSPQGLVPTIARVIISADSFPEE